MAVGAAVSVALLAAVMFAVAAVAQNAAVGEVVGWCRALMRLMACMGASDVNDLDDVGVWLPGIEDRACRRRMGVQQRLASASG